MTEARALSWWQTLPPAEAEVSCGGERHLIRWADGALALPAHPDAEAELVLATLGGAKAACVELAEFWGRRSSDLRVLTAGPRGPADRVPLRLEDLEALRGAVFGSPRTVTSARVGRPGRPLPRRVPRTVTSWPAAWTRLAASRLERLSLLALGPALQLRLMAAVAAAWQDRTPGPDRPVLAAALTGRLAPVAQAWLGIDPGRVRAVPHQGPGWGTVERTGAGLAASLPVGWLARVWAAGLATVGGHLVVAVQDARWPDARVLALPEPGARPVTLEVRAGAEGSGDGAHWDISTGR